MASDLRTPTAEVQHRAGQVLAFWFDALLPWDHWVFFKTWIVIPVTLVFAIANIPMLLRHGLQLDKPEDAPLPPEG